MVLGLQPLQRLSQGIERRVQLVSEASLRCFDDALDVREDGLPMEPAENLDQIVHNRDPTSAQVAMGPDPRKGQLQRHSVTGEGAGDPFGVTQTVASDSAGRSRAGQTAGSADRAG